MPTRKSPFARFAGPLFLLWITLSLALRVVAPASDPYSRLSWSSGLLTDEGFYLHNARNLVLFGQERTDDFNNALLMPTLHAVQVAVFRQFGVGIVQARAISIVASLLLLPVFFAALRRAFSLRVAVVGTLFLSLDHVMLLYNRMALMDTPAVFLLVGAFYAWVRAHPQKPLNADNPRPSNAWLLLCGLLFGLAFATRGLCAFLIPVPLVLLARKICFNEQSAGRRVLAFSAGLSVALALYLVLWYLPNRAELARVNAYYLRHQILPHSFAHFIRIAGSFFFGDERGVSPYLVRHTPALFALTLAGAIWRVLHRRKFNIPLSENTLFLGGWLLASWLLFGTSGYAPSRYYTLCYPALAGVAALAWSRLPEIWRTLYTPVPIRAIFGGFFAYHISLSLRPFPDGRGYAFVALITACVTLLPFLADKRKNSIKNKSEQGAVGDVPTPYPLHPTPRIQPLVLLLWACVNGFWLQDWLRHLSYTQRDAEQWLVAHLPPDTVLLGDVAPGLCINSRFRAVSVIPGLCNDNAPVERFAPAPRALVVLDGRAAEIWWTRRYPALVAPAKRPVFSAEAVGFPVGVYVVPPLKPASK